MKKDKNNNSPLGTSFDAFLSEDGLYEKASLAATKQVIALQIAEEMRKQSMSKTQMARRMDTSRSSLERLLDPCNQSVTLQTLEKAAHSLGRKIAVSLL